MFWAALAVFGAVVLFLPWEVITGEAVVSGADFISVHQRRMTFLRESATRGEWLPGWYSRELLGTGFSANLQSVPWIPTRLLPLLFEPRAAYAPGVCLASGLSATFTFLYARRLGLGQPAAALSAWTFAAAGFFSSRVLPGHLPLLEAYPALPLLLWLSERCLGPPGSIPRGGSLAWLALATACVSVAGHPQLPTYAIATCLVYVFARRPDRAGVVTALAVGAGAAATLVVWLPMLHLASSSTRALALATADNNVSFPFGRLVSLIVPGWDGWPQGMVDSEHNPFHGYPDYGYFWDTCNYTGILPPLALTYLLARWARLKERPRGVWLLLALLGAASFLSALPLLDPLREAVPGILLRSPARAMYVTTFTVALALGRAYEHAVRSTKASRPWVRWAGVTLLLLHLGDLGGFTQRFVELRPPRDPETGEFEAHLRRWVGDGRTAIDRSLLLDLVARFDDVGTIASIPFAAPYRALLTLGGLPPQTNLQKLDGSMLDVRALRWAGAAVVVTTDPRPDLQPIARWSDYVVYRVPEPEPRARFFSTTAVRFRSEDDMLEEMGRTPTPFIFLPTALKGVESGRSETTGPPHVDYRRPRSDEMRVRVRTPEDGWLKLLETHDVGWEATIDGRRVGISRADTCLMAVPVPSGEHEVVLRYRVPGRGGGLAGSICALLSLAALLYYCRRWRQAGSSRA